MIAMKLHMLFSTLYLGIVDDSIWADALISFSFSGVLAVRIKHRLVARRRQHQLKVSVSVRYASGQRIYE